MQISIFLIPLECKAIVRGYQNEALYSTKLWKPSIACGVWAGYNWRPMFQALCFWLWSQVCKSIRVSGRPERSPARLFHSSVSSLVSRPFIYERLKARGAQSTLSESSVTLSLYSVVREGKGEVERREGTEGGGREMGRERWVKRWGRFRGIEREHTDKEDRGKGETGREGLQQGRQVHGGKGLSPEGEVAEFGEVEGGGLAPHDQGEDVVHQLAQPGVPVTDADRTHAFRKKNTYAADVSIWTVTQFVGFWPCTAFEMEMMKEMMRLKSRQSASENGCQFPQINADSQHFNLIFVFLYKKQWLGVQSTKQKKWCQYTSICAFNNVKWSFSEWSKETEKKYFYW